MHLIDIARHARPHLDTFSRFEPADEFVPLRDAAGEGLGDRDLRGAGLRQGVGGPQTDGCRKRSQHAGANLHGLSPIVAQTGHMAHGSGPGTHHLAGLPYAVKLQVITSGSRISET